jgi:periplasmic divalent cation tolerance protein
VPNEILQVSTTLETPEEARRMARMLVERRLAACVQVLGPVESCYRWKEAVETAEEWLCVAKTTRARVAPLLEAIADAHAYELPEVVTAPLVATEAYARWVAEEVEPEGAAG